MIGLDQIMVVLDYDWIGWIQAFQSSPFQSNPSNPIYFEGVCLTTVILAPGASGPQGLTSQPWTISGRSDGIRWRIPRPHFLTTLPLISASWLGKPSPKSPPAASGGRARPWGVLGEPWDRFGRIWGSSGTARGANFAFLE